MYLHSIITSVCTWSVLLKRFLLIVLPWLLHAMEQFEARLFSNEAKLEDLVFQPLLDIRFTDPDQN